MKKTTYWFKAAILAIIMLCSYSSFSQSTQTVDFIATKDASINGKSGGDQTKNYGDCNELIVARKVTELQRALLQFDLSTIPTGSYIESAELRLNSKDDKNMTVSVFKIGSTDAWDEGNECGGTGSSNWNNRNSSSSWSTAGVVGSYNGGTPLATITANYKGIQSWFITSLVQDWVSGIATNNGVMLGSQDGGTSGDKSKYESTD